MRLRKIMVVLSLLIFLCASAPISDSSQGKKILHPWVESLVRNYGVDLDDLPRPYGTGTYSSHTESAPNIHLVYALDGEPNLSAEFISNMLEVFPEVFDQVEDDFWKTERIHIVILPFNKFERLMFMGRKTPKNQILYGSTTLMGMPSGEHVIFLWELSVKTVSHEIMHILLLNTVSRGVAADESIIRRMTLRFMVSNQLKKYLRKNLK